MIHFIKMPYLTILLFFKIIKKIHDKYNGGVVCKMRVYTTDNNGPSYGFFLFADLASSFFESSGMGLSLSGFSLIAIRKKR